MQNFRYPFLFAFVAFFLASCAPRGIEAPPAPEGPFVPPMLDHSHDQLLSQPLPLDSGVRTGQLDNGLTYFIQRNTEPQDRAELRLVVNAGSILEDEDQLGMAHLVEHMAFNGTDRFPELELVNYLEGIGMRFGPDLNAYTSFDETVYMLQVPTDDQELLETGLIVLREWAGSVTMHDQDIDDERGVVLEEWRLGRGAGARMRDVQFPVLFGGSQYAERLPIGKPEIIEHTPTDAIRRYYNDWYRPDLMAVVVVGNIDVDEIEQFIHETFADLNNPDNPRERTNYRVPTHDDTRFAIATDPEQTINVIQVLRKLDAQPTITVADFRENLIDDLYVNMLNARLAEITQRPGAPILGGSALIQQFVRPIQVAGIAAAVPEGGLASALQALMVEIERVRIHGFTQGELDRAMADTRRRYQQAYDERNSTPSRVYASRFVNHYLNGDAVAGIEREYALLQGLLPTITLADVDTRAEVAAGESNRVVMISAPERAGVAAPDEAELRTILEAVSSLEIEPYVDEEIAEALISGLPAPGTIVSESRYADDEITEWTLSNGARVVIRPTDFRSDEVLFAAFGGGGLSLVTDEEYHTASQATAAVQRGGLGEFSAVNLDRALAGTAASVQPYISGTEQGLRGRASPSDIETLFELVYLNFTSPRHDADAFEAHKEQQAQFLANRANSPMMVFMDTLSAISSQYHLRSRSITVEELNAVNLDDALRIYRQRFADAGSFTFVFVGNVTPEQLAPYVEQYIASLPSTGSNESAVDLGIRPPDGVVERNVYKGLEEQARVQIIFSGDLNHADGDEGRWERFVLRTLGSAMSIRLREELREERGGVYGVGVGFSPSRLSGTYSASISFGADPNRVDELVDAIFEQIQIFQSEGPPQDVLDRVLETVRRGQETDLRTNNYWLNNLLAAYRYDEDPADYLRQDDLWGRMTVNVLRDAAVRYFNEGRYIRVVLLPEDR